MVLRTSSQRKAFFAKLKDGAGRMVEIGKREAKAMPKVVETRRKFASKVEPHARRIAERRADIQRLVNDIKLYKAKIRQVQVQHRSDMRQEVAELQEKIAEKKLKIREAASGIREAKIAISEQRKLQGTLTEKLATI